jgi:methanethiol S-methyltransferase
MWMNDPYDYGLWPLVFFSSLVFLIFAFSFTRPKNWRDWRSFGAFAAFIVALFTEMYGFPLTIYLLSGWLGTRYPQLDLFSHDAGHLWQTLFGIQGTAHFNPLHVLSSGMIGVGFWIIASAWRVLYQAQRSGALATTGPYARVRHPQYVGFVIVLVGLLLQWPTLLTLLMLPFLIWMYSRLARIEEGEMRTQMPDKYDRYAAGTPAFVPRSRHMCEEGGGMWGG